MQSRILKYHIVMYIATNLHICNYLDPPNLAKLASLAASHS